MPRRTGAARQQDHDERAGAEPPALPATPAAVPDLLLSKIRSDFEEFGLNGYQARVLLALLRAGSAPPPYLAQLSGVHRTSAYPVLEELRAKGLAVQLPGRTAVWTTPGRDEVLARLVAAQEERLRALQAKRSEMAAALAQVVPETPTDTAVPYLHFVSSAAQTRTIYDRLLDEVQAEFLVLNRPPYSAATERSRRHRALTEAAGRDEVNPAVGAALERGVSIRVLYQTEQWDDPAAEEFRAAMGAYHDAGVEGRVVEELPMKLVVADRQVALLALADPVLREIGFPTNLFIEHPGYAAFQADAFEHRWAGARPITGKHRRRSSGGAASTA
jgi:HTH-type transcriptional regulator, sugar sensing transcriptional regulator